MPAVLREWFVQVGVVLALLVSLVLLPLLLPFAAISTALEKRKKRAAAEGFPCVQCGKRLRGAALDLSDRTWAEEAQAIRAAHPHLCIRLVRRSQATCIHCGAEYAFDGASGVFTFVPPEVAMPVESGSDLLSLEPN